MGGTAALISPATCGNDSPAGDDAEGEAPGRAPVRSGMGAGRLLRMVTRDGRCGGYGTRRQFVTVCHTAVTGVGFGGKQRAGAVIPRDDDPGRGTARPLPSDGR
ncbi:hypothetical protein GCM10009608_81530 [Pseudonocardia alaniniphila]